MAAMTPAPAQLTPPPRWMHRCIGAWTLLLALCMAPAALAAGVNGDLGDYTHDVWTTRDGLPHNTINDMTQSGEGYLWLATWEGLVRYNGNEFRLYDRRSQPALRDSAIAALYAGRNGGLWFADSRGNLGRWQSGDRLRYWGRAEGLPGTVIDGVFEDAQGQVWITLNGTGLGRLQPASGRFDLLRPAEQGSGFVGIRPAQDDAGRLWIGTLRGLMYVDGDRLLPAPDTFKLPPGLAWPYRAPDGRIWVVAGNTLYRMHGDELRAWRTLPRAGRITALLQDGYGTLWLGTENRGVLRVGEDGVEQVGRGMGLPEGRVAVLFEDHEHSLWAGVNGGLYRLREALFGTIGVQAGLGNDFVRTLAEDGQGRVWIGGSSGLDAVEPDGRIHHVVLQPANANRGEVSVLALLALDGELWAGTYGDGLYRLRDGHTLARYDHDDGLPNNHVRSLARARDGGLWIGTRQGVGLLRDGVVQPLQAPGLPRTLVHALLETERGELWIAALSGLYRYADGVAERIPLGDGDDDGRRVLALYHDAARDALWISSDRGLYRLRGGTLAHVGLEQGLPVDAVFQMVVDGHGSAWLGSNRGVLRMDYAQLDAVADGRAERVGVDLYGNRDGMANAQGNGGSGTSTLLASDGAVWFATAGGATVVQPERMRRFRELPPPTVVVEGLLADGRPLSFVEPGEVRVPAGTRRLAISYAALTYLSPQGVRYRSRLDGFDRDWVPRGSHRTVEFTSLPPGDYTFRVEAANGEGAQTGEGAVLHLRIEPYWWQRASVRVAAALALALLAFGLYRRRLAQYRRDTTRLERLVDERTGDLKRQAEQLAEADREKQGLLDRLGAQARLLERQAHQDALTGLPNRRAFEERAAAEIARMQAGAALSLAVLDIDRFKRINDERSHATGDAVLRRFAQVAGEACRPGDFIARHGGEEFVLLLPGLPLPAALALCERLRAAVQDSDLAEVAQGLPVTVSIGVVEGAGGAGLDALMQAADAALYRAKNGGRNRVESAGRLA